MTTPDPTRDARPARPPSNADAALAATGEALNQLAGPHIYPDPAAAYAAIGIVHALLELADVLRERDYPAP